MAVFLSLYACAAFAENSPVNKQDPPLNCFPRLGLCVDETLTVKSLIQGSPSETGGILKGDTVIAIEGRPVEQLTFHQRVKLLVGEPGSVSHLVVLRGQKKYSVSLTRVDPLSNKTAGKLKNDGLTQHQGAATQAVGSTHQQGAEPTELDKAFVTISRHTDKSDAIYQGVMQGLAQLPVDVKTKLRDNGVGIVISPSRGEFNHTSGGCAYQVGLKKVIIAEYDNRVNKELPVQRLPLTTLHELGHAYDHVAGTTGVISSEARFVALYQDEADKVPQGKRVLLAYFLPPNLNTNTKDPAPVHAPPQECFASLFACKYFKGEDKRLDALKASFPNTYKFVANLKP